MTSEYAVMGILRTERYARGRWGGGVLGEKWVAHEIQLRASFVRFAYLIGLMMAVMLMMMMSNRHYVCATNCLYAF